MAKTLLHIEQLGPHGDGIAHSPRGIVYVDRTAPGDTLEASVKKDAKGILRGEPLQFHELSPLRINPPCRHFEECGNCTLQHISKNFYQSWKEEKVRLALRKWKLKPATWLPSLFLGGANRRRATFSLTRNRGKLIAGYYQRRSQQLSHIAACEVALPDLLERKQALEPFLSALVQEGEVLDLFLQKIGNQYEAVLTEPKKTKKEFLTALIESDLLDRFALKTKKGIQTLHQPRELYAHFGELKVALPPASFLQPTVEGEMALTQAVLQAVSPSSSIADLFSGAGTFSGPLLSRGPVSSFEWNLHAVNNLKKAAKDLPLQAFRRDLFLNPLKSKELKAFETVVLDPPRAGCLEQARWIAQSRCPTVVSISCNPATFARDAHALVQGGYFFKSVQVIDQFLWSSHVEMVGVFLKKS